MDAYQGYALSKGVATETEKLTKADIEEMQRMMDEYEAKGKA